MGGRSVYPRSQQIVTALILGAFITVTLATTVYSLGTYCLTSGNGPVGLLGFRSSGATARRRPAPPGRRGSEQWSLRPVPSGAPVPDG